MQSSAYEPQQPIARQDFEQQAQEKAAHFLARGSLLVPERPILVQEKTTGGTTEIGQRIVDHQDLHLVGGKAPEQDSEDKYIQQRVRYTHQAVAEPLPEETAPVLVAMDRSIEEFLR